MQASVWDQWLASAGVYRRMVRRARLVSGRLGKDSCDVIGENLTLYQHWAGIVMEMTYLRSRFRRGFRQGLGSISDNLFPYCVSYRNL